MVDKGISRLCTKIIWDSEVNKLLKDYQDKEKSSLS